MGRAVISPGAPSAGGGGMTKTTFTYASLSSGDVQFETIPSAPTNEGLLCSIAADYADSFPSSSSFQWNSSDWTFEDLNTGGASWVNDGGATGHFTAAGSAKIVAGCGISIAGSARVIDALVGNGTAPGSVTLSGAEATGAIDYIRGLYADGMSKVRNFTSGVAGNPVHWYTALWGYPELSFLWDEWISLTTTSLAAGGALVKMAFQPVAGGSWYYFANASGTWETMDPTSETEWNTKGCVVPNGGGAIQDDTGVNLTTANLTAIGFPVNGNMATIVALKPAAGAAAEIQGGNYTYNRVMSQIVPVDKFDGFNYPVAVFRTSATTIAIYSLSDASNVVVSVWT